MTAQTKVTSSTRAPVSRRSRHAWRAEGSSPNRLTAAGRGCTDTWRGDACVSAVRPSSFRVPPSSQRLHVCVRRGKALQESLIKVVEACGDASNNMDRWLSKLENSKWLSHVQTALSTAGLLAECVERCGPEPGPQTSGPLNSTVIMSE